MATPDKSGTSKKLYLEFTLDNGNLLTLTVNNPKDDITADDIRPVMQNIVSKHAFVSGTAVPSAISDAYLRTTETTNII